jgi:hypothetical protein
MAVKAPHLGQIVYYRSPDGLLAVRSALVVATSSTLDPREVAAGDAPAISSWAHAHLHVLTPGVAGWWLEYDVPSYDGPDTGVVIDPGTWCPTTRPLWVDFGDGPHLA